MIQTFEIPGRLSGCNEYQRACRTSPRVGARMKRDNQDRAYWAIKAAKVKPAAGPVNVWFAWIEPDMRRDKDNIRFAAKFVLDALVQAGILPDDGWRYVGDLSDSYAVNKSNPRIIVTLED